MDACIVGWAHTPFGKLESDDIESLIVRVSRGALEDANVGARDIDSVHVGVFNSGLSGQDFFSSMVLQADEGFRFKPAVRVENACATGTAAIHSAMHFIEARRGRLALVVGAEKMTGLPTAAVSDALLGASYRREEGNVKGGFAGVFANIASRYFDRYGDHSDILARIAAKNHRNGVDNPLAQLRKDLGYELCRQVSEKNPYVAEPLRRTDCSLISDGAAAVVLADRDTAHGFKKAIAFRASAHVNDYLPLSRRDPTFFDAAAEAWRQALAEARVALTDLSLVETHDCFTIAELLEYEAMGLTPPGEGRRAVVEGWTEKGGKLPVNASGGLKSKGHPVGATGVSMHVMAALQLCGQAGGMQIPGASLAGIFNMGGAAVANYVSILERLH